MRPCRIRRVRPGRLPWIVTCIVIDRIHNWIAFVGRMAVKHLVKFQILDRILRYVRYRVCLQEDVSLAIDEGIGPNEAPTRQKRPAFVLFFTPRAASRLDLRPGRAEYLCAEEIDVRLGVFPGIVC